MSTKLTFDGAVAAIGRLYDGEVLAPIATAAGLIERDLFEDLSAFTAKIRTVLEAARPAPRSIHVAARGGLHGPSDELPAGVAEPS